VKFDIFYQLPEAANQVTTDRYRELIAEAAEADRLGFNTVWLAEVHFAPRFSVMPTPLLLLAAIAERTSNIRLGMAVNLMPLHHPIRLAEEVATLDVLSGGRVEFGAGRGAFPLNYRGYGVEMADSRALFQDGLETIKAAWTDTLPDEIKVVPRPIQRPFPPIRLAANSADTFTFAGANRYPIFAGGPVNPIPVLAERLKIYDDALKDAGHERPDDWLAAALMVFVGRDRAHVRATIEPSLRNYFNAVSEIIEPESLAASHRVEFQKVRDRLRTIDYSTIDSMMAVFGDPEYCIDRIAELKEQFGFSRLVCWFEIGGISGHQNVLAAMRLFADRVMPKFQ
jgi:alkanesulfonate monooxygenase SsuD/methylene tetrahydromethanopterin reductase-like flavin-dependent oxidoreductase (luciferase family)